MGERQHFKYTADTRDLDRKLEKSRQQSMAAADGSGALRAGLLGVAAAATAVAGVLAKSAQAYAVQIESERRLALAIKNTGASIDAANIKRLASDLQSVTTFGDEATISAAALLVQFGATEDQLGKLLPLTQDLAATYGIDLTAATKVLGQAMSGSAGSLSRYGVILTENEKAAFKLAEQSERVEIITKKLAGTVGGTAQLGAQTAVGAFTQLKNSVGDLTEEIGRLTDEGAGGWIRDVVVEVDRLTVALRQSAGAADLLNRLFASSVLGKALGVEQPLNAGGFTGVSTRPTGAASPPIGPSRPARKKAGRKSGGGGGGASTPQIGLADAFADQDFDRDEMQARLDAEREGFELMLDLRERHLENQARLDERAAEKELRDFKKLLEEKQRLAEESAQAQAAVAMSFVNIGIQSVEMMLTQAITNQEIAFEQIAAYALRASGSAIVGIGTEQIAKGVGLSILGSPQGPALIGSGSGFVALGLGMGAAGAAVSAASSAAGGGAGVDLDLGSSTSSNASPSLGGLGSTPGGDGQTSNTYVFNGAVIDGARAVARANRYASEQLLEGSGSRRRGGF